MHPFHLHRHAGEDAGAGVARLQLELERARRHAHPLTLLRFGARHDARRAAGAIRGLVRAVDHVWTERRDVLVLLVETDRATAEAFLTRARVALPELLAGENVGVGCFPEELTGNALLAATAQRPSVGLLPRSRPLREALPETSAP